MTLFLEGIFDTDNTSPSTILLRVPVRSDKYKSVITLRGLLTSEVNIRSANKWGPVIPDVNTLTSLSSMWGGPSMFSWIGASTLCWQGTEPIKLPLEFYLINYKPNLNLESGIRGLMKLTSISQTDNKGLAKVYVHGGYQADLFSNNPQFFEKAGKSFVDLKENTDLVKVGTDILSQGGSNVDPGTVSVQIGSRIKYKGLLVSSVDITPSLVEVAGRNGEDPKPLYYRVSLSLTGARPLLYPEIDDLL